MPHPHVTFSAHAEERMMARSISERHVLWALANPDRVIMGRQGNPISEKAIGRRTIPVVYVDRIGADGWHTHVKTVMWK
jgi:hypothetical protein